MRSSLILEGVPLFSSNNRVCFRPIVSDAHVDSFSRGISQLFPLRHLLDATPTSSRNVNVPCETCYSI